VKKYAFWWVILIITLAEFTVILLVVVPWGEEKYWQGFCNYHKLSNQDMYCNCKAESNVFTVSCVPKVKNYPSSF
jgi:hypothetical protein